MSQSPFAAVILAAGSGTRMKSAIPKVMHPIAGRPMIAYPLEALRPLSPAATLVVIGPRMESVAAIVAPAECFVLAPDGALERIVEAADAGPEEQAIGLVNGGIMVIEASHLAEFLDALESDNAKREFYLTDIVAIARRKGFACRAVELPAEELLGVNTRAE